MNWRHTVATAIAVLLPCAVWAQTASPRVYIDSGNIFIERNGTKTKLTTSGMDVDPVLSPGGTIVAYTRQGHSGTLGGDDCSMEPRPDELRQTNIDGSGDKRLLTGRKGDPEQQLCDFRSKQFSSDGRWLYFLTPGWATSGALHVYDMRTGDEHFVRPANDLLVLGFCTNKYKDDLVVLSHRYFLFGGSYDWYWLYDPTGKNELGPLGPLDDFNGPDDVVRQAREVWCNSKP